SATSSACSCAGDDSDQSRRRCWSNATRMLVSSAPAVGPLAMSLMCSIRSSGYDTTCPRSAGHWGSQSPSSLKREAEEGNETDESEQSQYSSYEAIRPSGDG